MFKIPDVLTISLSAIVAIVKLLCSVLGRFVSGCVRNCNSKEQNNNKVDVRVERESSMVTLVRSAGYPLEEYEVVTEDGYILTLFRIPHGPTGNSKRRGVVYLQHGFNIASSSWVLGDSNNTLAYQLADDGFDVWIGNTRGNNYSEKHLSKDPETSSFWEFSIHEMGIYDISAIIDFILLKTGRPRLDYIGNSVGTMVFYILMAMRPEFNQKIGKMIALASIVYGTHVTTPLRHIMTKNTIGRIVKRAEKMDSSKGQLLRYNKNVKYVFKQISQHNASIWEYFIIEILYGADREIYNQELTKAFFENYDHGSSVRVFEHGGQVIYSGIFRPYVHEDPELNIKHYGADPPPPYNFDNITVPIYSFWTAENDKVSSAKDIPHFHSKLPNLKQSIQIRRAGFGHTDYVFALDANVLVNNPIRKILSNEIDS